MGEKDCYLVGIVEEALDSNGIPETTLFNDEWSSNDIPPFSSNDYTMKTKMFNSSDTESDHNPTTSYYCVKSGAFNHNSSFRSTGSRSFIEDWQVWVAQVGVISDENM